VPPRTSVTLTMVITLVQLPQRVRCLPSGIIRAPSPACIVHGPTTHKPDNVCALHLGAGACALLGAPVLRPPGDNGIEHRAHPGYIGRIIHIDRALRRIEHAIERLAHARGTRRAPPRTKAPATPPTSPRAGSRFSSSRSPLLDATDASGVYPRRQSCNCEYA
jgi:hypothetical protein